MDNRGKAWMSHMLRGDFDAAWVISDEVLSERQGLSCDDRPRHEQWVWRGEPLRGNVLIRCNHGLGDTIQFIRYAAIIRDMVERVVVEAPPELLSLLRTAKGIDQVVPQGHEDDTFYDVAVEVMELPHVLRTDIHNIPARVPYFRIAPEAVSFTDRLNVGLVWHAGDWDLRRSIPFELVRQLATVPGITWHVLQQGSAAKMWDNSFGVNSSRTDLLQLAQFLSVLPLLISIDSMPAHLSGALAVRTWTLLHANCDWRWMAHRSDSPWYPTMRLFRQKRSGDWRSVLDQVKNELTTVCQNDDPVHTLKTQPELRLIGEETFGGAVASSDQEIRACERA
jgi:hypothetical protein